ncbi:MAG: hypothetical protein KAG97_00140, partial [Victivallales bacterium]|nr:hypothetical protein [Victivallales bacterium]
AIPAENIDIRTVTCHWQSPSESISGTAKYAAELLEKNIPFSLKEHRTQPLFINVRIPNDLPPGNYTSDLIVSPMNLPKSTVKISIRVLPLRIVAPKDKTWHLFNDATRWFLMNDTQLQNEIRDIADHGINSLKLGYAPYCGTFIEENGKIVDADFGRMGEGMRMAAKFGIDNSVFISSTNAMCAHLRGWRPSTSGSAKVAIVEIEDAGRKIKVAKLKTTASGDRAAVSLSKPICVAVGEPLRLSLRYKSTGSIKGTLGIGFQTLRRVRTNAGAKSAMLPSTNGKWKTVSIVTTVPENAPETMVSVVAAGAAGEMFIDEIKLLKSDGLVNRLINGKFDRGFAMKNYETKWPAEFMSEYTDAVKAHLKAAKRMGFKDAYMEGKDEAGASPKYEMSETQELEGAKLAGKVWCNLSMDLAEKAKDNLDGICFYSEMLGSVDFSDKLLKHYHDLG